MRTTDVFLAFYAALCYTALCARGISTVGRTNHPYLRPTGKQFRKPTIGADGKSGRNCYQIRGISTDGSARHSHCRGQGFDSPMLHKKTLQIKVCKVFRAHFSVVQSMQILHSCPWYITQGFSFAACDPSHLFPPGHTRLANTPRILRLIVPFSLITGFSCHVAVVRRV